MSKSLRSLVLKGRLKAPVQRGYVPADWDKALALGQPTEEDRRLHFAARFFGDQLAGIRRKLVAAPPPSGSLSSSVRRAIGFVNRETLTAEKNALEGLPSVAWVDELVQKKIELAGGLNTATADQIVEGVVDGLRFELSSILEHPPSPRERLHDAEEIQRIILRANLSNFYHILEEQWLDCLHLGWEVQKLDASVTLITPVDNAAAINWAISQHRAQVLDYEIAERSARMLMNLDDNPLGQTLGIVTQGSGKRQKYAVSSLTEGQAIQIHAARMLAAEPDLEPFTKTRLMTGLTPAEMLQIWSALAPLAHDLANKVPLDERIIRVGQLEQFAPVQDEMGLLSALQRSTGLSRKLCAAALEQLIWRDSRDSLWHRPFVRLKRAKQLFVVIPALKFPNLRRSIEYWFNEGGGDLSERGEWYESHVREEIAQGIGANRVLQKRAGVLLRSVEPPDDSVGDLDLVFWIGKTVVIGEVKCLLRPATSHDWFKYEVRIHEAVQQVTRKAAYVRENRDWFQSKLGEEGVEIDSGFTVVPCVILNSPVGSLRIAGSVPIVDVYVLSRYLEEGFAIMHASLADEATGEKIRLYNDAQEAEERLEEFLLEPLNLRPYRQSVKWEVRVQPDFAHDLGLVFYKFPGVEVDLPKPNWAA